MTSISHPVAVSTCKLIQMLVQPLNLKAGLTISFYSVGPAIYDVRKFLGFFDPLPPCPHLGLIYSTKFTQPPLLHLLLG